MTLWSRWLALLDRQETGESLALCRIACGLCVLASIGSVVAHGLVDVLWLDLALGGYRSLGDGSWLVRSLGGPTPAAIWSLVALALAGGAATVVGIGGRAAPLAALLGYQALVSRNGHAVGSYDLLLTNALWLLFLSSSTATWSLDALRRGGAWRSERRISAWPRLLLIGQLVLVYFTSGLQKLSAHWTPLGNFSALYYILQQPSWQRFDDMSWLGWLYPLTQLGTAAVRLWELSSPLLLAACVGASAGGGGRVARALQRFHFRRTFVALGLAMHLGVWVLLDVGPFSWVALSLYPALCHPDELRADLDRLARRPAAEKVQES